MQLRRNTMLLSDIWLPHQLLMLRKQLQPLLISLCTAKIPLVVFTEAKTLLLHSYTYSRYSPLVSLPIWFHNSILVSACQYYWSCNPAAAYMCRGSKSIHVYVHLITKRVRPTKDKRSYSTESTISCTVAPWCACCRDSWLGKHKNGIQWHEQSLQHACVHVPMTSLLIRGEN